MKREKRLVKKVLKRLAVCKRFTEAKQRGIKRPRVVFKDSFLGENRVKRKIKEPKVNKTKEVDP
ncbi:MAG: hypothetical protein HQ579_02145 [Candidatus Omnitrophica bacterium]|nr:hypothetical protein [Candidatus Omnitrophota bacterium]